MVNTGHMKTKGVFAGTAIRKLTNTPAVIFSYPCWGRWFSFTKQIIIVLFWVIFYSYLQKFFRISVILKTFHNSQETPVSEFHFNQPVACYFFNKRHRHRCFLVKFAKLSRTPFLQTTLVLLLLYLLNISVISPNLVFSTKWLFHPFETLTNIEMYTFEIKIMRKRENLFSFFTSDSVNLLLSAVNSFITEVATI